MKNKPEVVTKTSKSRDVKMTVECSEHRTMAIAYLRRHIPNFRGFKDEEFDFLFLENGQVLVHAYKETST